MWIKQKRAPFAGAPMFLVGDARIERAAFGSGDISYNINSQYN
jgi:hypothetical protein